MQYDTTRAYLHRVLPWVKDAFVTAHYVTPNPHFDPSKPENNTDNKRMWLNGQAFKTPADVLGYIRYMVARPKARDIYVCMSAFSYAEERQAGGRTYYSAKRGKDFCIGHKALYMDLDVKADDENAYPTDVALFTAFKAFLKATGLPVPTMFVASGTGGAHAYWCLDRVIHPDEWSVLSQALAEATRREGLRVDTQCIVDKVRLLRPPETFNYKRAAPLPVIMGHVVQPNDISVEEMHRILLPYKGAKVIPIALARPGNSKAKGNANDELSAGIQEAIARPMGILSVAKACGFVRDALGTGGATFSQPLWNMTTLLASFTAGTANGVEIDGRTIAHAMSAGHSGYVQADTDALYDRKMDERQRHNLGWPSCRAIENAGCKNCGSCALKVFDKSPLSHARPHGAIATPGLIQTAQVVPTPNPASNLEAQDSHLPRGYIASPEGLIQKIVVGQNGQASKLTISPYPIHSGYLQKNPWILHFKTRLGPRGGDSTISIATANLQSREYGKYLAGQGLVSPPDQLKDLQEFLLSWVSQLQAIRETVSSSPFGWSIVNGSIEGFVYGGRCWMPNDSRPAAVPHEVTASQYQPVGDLNKWQAACAFLTGQNRPDLNAIIAAAFGAPLMRFTGRPGAIISAYSIDSGIGKTTFMEVGQSVWGHPRKAMNSLEDTQNSVINKAGQLRNLPLFWDELKGSDQKSRFVKIAFQITGGKEKSRLTSDADQRDPGTWQTLVMGASNDSLVDAVSRELKTTEAGILRIFEYVVEPARRASSHSNGYVSRLIQDCQDNYGLAGLEYAKFLGANHQRVKDEVSQCYDHITAHLQSPNEERFWTAAACCILMGARYANQLGLTSIDERSLFKFLKQTMEHLRGMRKLSAVNMSRPDVLANVLGAYLSAMSSRYTLVTDHIPLSRGKPVVCTVLSPDMSRIESVLVRIAKEDNVICISKDDFVSWLVKNDYAPHSILQALRAVFSVTTSQRVLAAGTLLATSSFRRTCIEIDYSGTAFAEVLEKNE